MPFFELTKWQNSSYTLSDKKSLSLTSYQLILGIINEEKLSMKNAGVKKEEIINVIDKIEEDAKKQDLTHELLQSKKKEVLNLASKIRKDLEVIYLKIG